ncbi:response regulator [Alkalinema sp. FACHB-956]|uniref:response regulator n=1 Tax=Alkalinema sp. FACHB-956 TaxID=2692768 RepID=UPI00168394EB|nr:response regulator [Alkalinema sp. FACHB-956]MBD2325773.1 response regulator [Alkalinema sp. FACHB-956]
MPAAKKPVIICVDDEPMVLASLKTELKRILGDAYLIETTEDGEEALELFGELQVDGYEVAVVLADYIMPGLKGDELLEQIHDRSPNTLNIMISGQADLEGISNAIEGAQLYRYILKPWKSEELGATVSEALHHYLYQKKLEAQATQLVEVNCYLQQSLNELQGAHQEMQLLNTRLESQVQAQTTELHQKDQQLQAYRQRIVQELRPTVADSLEILQQSLYGEPNAPIPSNVPMPKAKLEKLVALSKLQLSMLDQLLAIQSKTE